MSKRLTMACAGFVSLLCTIPVLSADITIETARGAVSVPQTPDTVAVFDIAAADTIDALGIEINGLPDNVYVKHLETAGLDAEPVGTLFEPDFEAINAMKPDLIVAGGRSSTQVDALSKFAPTIDMTIWGEDVIDQARQRLTAYGDVFGVQEKASQLETALLDDVKAAREAVAGKGKGLIILVNGPKISAYGPGSRFGWLHTELGLEPAVQDIDTAVHGEAVSFEFIHDANPDWLIVIDRAAAIRREGAAARQTLDNRLVNETTAWKSNQVVFLDAGNIYIATGGYTAIRGTLAEITSAFAGSE